MRLVGLQVEYLNLADTNSNLKGFRGGFATDAHAYYVPLDNGSPHGYAARVSLSDSSSSGVEYLNLAETNPNLKGFIGGFGTDARLLRAVGLRRAQRLRVACLALYLRNLEPRAWSRRTSVRASPLPPPRIGAFLWVVSGLLGLVGGVHWAGGLAPLRVSSGLVVAHWAGVWGPSLSAGRYVSSFVHLFVAAARAPC